MEGINNTRLTEFILREVTDIPQLNALLFGAIATFYLINIVGNISIITVVISDSWLHTPMYFLLSNLSFVDIGISSVVVPKMMINVLLEKKTISYECCITQMFFFQFFGGTEAWLLTSMSYDRYVAICHPLRYVVIMNQRVCILLTCFSWGVGFIHSFFHTLLIARLPFCSANHVSHFFCDIKPLLKLACTNTYINELLLTVVTGFAAGSTFFLIIVSYILISSHLLKIRSSKGRQKAFSTCVSHLTIVVFFLGTAICTYIRPATKDSLNQDRIAAILFSVVTPTLNPCIYTLRNKEVKRAMRKIVCGSQNAV